MPAMLGVYRCICLPSWHRLPGTALAGACLLVSALVASARAQAPDFATESVSAQVRDVVHWALRSGDHAGRSVVVVDKKAARIFVLDPAGRLRGAAPVLLGAARGDDSVAGIGTRPLAQIRPNERTTPAGRFIAEPGINATGEDIVWVDYEAAVSMHRVRAHVKSERRLERLATETPDDNRISYGCINLPRRFYEQVLAPAVRTTGAVIYVLPEVRSLREVFGLWSGAARPM